MTTVAYARAVSERANPAVQMTKISPFRHQVRNVEGRKLVRQLQRSRQCRHNNREEPAQTESEESH